MSHLRFRHVYIVILSIFTLLLLVATDPDSGLIQHLPFGASALATLTVLSVAVLFVSLLHVSRKGLFDYIDMGDLADKARQESTGAGLVFMGICIAMLAIAIVIFAATA